MVLATSGTFTLSKSKMRRLRARAERLYEEKFHSRWFRDPSARATRNKYRQLLADTLAPESQRQEPYMNTLIRGDYYGRDGDAEARTRPKPCGIVFKNKILQGQPHLSGMQKRAIARSIRRPGRTPTHGETSAATAHSVPDPQSLTRDQEYWDLLHHLNRRRRVDFHNAFKFGRDQKSAMALALTDITFDKFRHRGADPASPASDADVPGKGAADTHRERWVQQQPLDASGTLGPDDIAMRFRDGEPAAGPSALPPPPAPPPPPPGSPPAPGSAAAAVQQPQGGGRVRRGIAIARQTAAQLAKGAEDLSPRRAGRDESPRRVGTVPTATRQRGSAAAKRRTANRSAAGVYAPPSAGSIGVLAQGQHHHVAVADHSHRRVGGWRNPTNYADQRVPVAPTDI